jgi:phosphatidylserine/phosphatidylglycerophosphate/cardiolipin synthase-like enzyme
VKYFPDQQFLRSRIATAFLVAAASAFGIAAAPAAHAGQIVPMPPTSAHASTEVFFSPGADTDHAIAGLIATARDRVWVAGYYFTSATIAKALDRAHARGVDVRVVLDRSQATQKYSSATYFHNRGVALWINARYPVMHHKFLVVDADTVGFGSMNFTGAGAQKNAENFNLFRRWPALVAPYAAEFERLAQESVRYRPGMTFDDDRAPADRSERQE